MNNQNNINSNNIEVNLNNINQLNISNNQKIDELTLYDINKPKPLEDMPYVFCKRCNGRVVADSNFCSNCGNKISR